MENNSEDSQSLSNIGMQNKLQLSKQKMWDVWNVAAATTERDVIEMMREKFDYHLERYGEMSFQKGYQAGKSSFPPKWLVLVVGTCVGLTMWLWDPGLANFWLQKLLQARDLLLR